MKKLTFVLKVIGSFATVAGSAMWISLFFSSGISAGLSLITLGAGAWCLLASFAIEWLQEKRHF